MYGSASENFYSEGNSRGNQLRMVELVFCSLIQIFRLVHLKSNPKSWVFSPGQAYFLIFEVLIHPWIFHFKIMREARVILVPPWEDESILRHGRFFDYMKIQTFVTQSNFFLFFAWNRSPAQVGCMRQALGPGALGRPRGSGWRGRWEVGLGWGHSQILLACGEGGG